MLTMSRPSALDTLTARTFGFSTDDALDLSYFKDRRGTFLRREFGLDGEPLFYLDATLAPICNDCADGMVLDGEPVVGVGVNRDNELMRCACCDTSIESTYGEPRNLE